MCCLHITWWYSYNMCTARIPQQQQQKQTRRAGSEMYPYDILPVYYILLQVRTHACLAWSARPQEGQEIEVRKMCAPQKKTSIPDSSKQSPALESPTHGEAIPCLCRKGPLSPRSKLLL